MTTNKLTVLQIIINNNYNKKPRETTSKLHTFWMVKGQWKEDCLRKGTSIYLAVNPTGCQVHNCRPQIFGYLYKTTLPINGQGQQPVSFQDFYYASFVYRGQISLKCFHFTGIFLSFAFSLFYEYFNFSLSNSFVIWGCTFFFFA